MSRLDPVLADLRAQLAQKPALRWMLLAVGLLAGLMLVQALADHKQRLRVELANESLRLERMRVAGAEAGWPARAEAARTLHEALLAEIPLIDTPGMAQAEVQGWLREVARSLGPAGSNPNISSPPVAVVDEAMGLVRVRATFNAGLPPAQAMQLLRRVESNPNLMLVESMQVRNDHNKTASLTLAAYYRVGARSAE